MEELHNQIVSLIIHNIKSNKISVSEVVLLLEMIKTDLVIQVAGDKYKEEPVDLGTKKPAKIVKMKKKGKK